MGEPQDRGEGPVGTRLLWQLVRRFWGHIALLLLFISFSVTCSLLLPLLNRAIIDKAIVGRDLSLLNYYIIFYLIIIISISFANFFREYFYGIFTNRLFHETRLLLFSKFLRARLSVLHDFTEGDLLHIIMEDIKVFRNFITEILLACFTEIITLIITFYILHQLSPLIAWLSLGFFVFYFFSYRRFHQLIKERGERLRHSQAQVTGGILEAVRGLLTIKVYNAYAQEEDHLSRLSRELQGQRLVLLLLHAGLHQATHLLLLGGGVLIWYLGGKKTISGTLSLGTLVAVSEYFLRLMRPLTHLANAHALYRTDLASLRKVAALLSYPEEPVSPVPDPAEREGLGKDEPPKPRLGKIHSITFDRVSYTPPGSDQPLLREVSFTLMRGDKAALIGPSGAGKTTLVALLLGLVAPSGGRILLNQRELGEWDLTSLRESIAYTPQSPFIFSRPLKANLAYPTPVPEAELRRLVQTLSLEELVRAHGGQLEAPVSSHCLSGGEAQRLALGRTLLRPAEVYIFDESFSQVDKACADAILEEILSRPERTCLVITHDLTLLHRLEKVFLLEDGRIRLLQEIPALPLRGRQGPATHEKDHPLGF